MSISLEDAEKYELLDFDILQSIPKRCNCGAKLQFDDSMSNVVCSDVSCRNDVAERLYGLVRDSGQQLWTPEDCTKLTTELGLKTPYSIYVLPRLVEKRNIDIKNIGAKLIDVCDPTHSVQIQDVAEDIKVLTNQKLRRLELSSIVELSNHSEIKVIAKDLFRGMRSLKEAYVYIKLWPVMFVAERLGLRTDNELKLAAEIYDRLLQIEDELKYGEKFFTILDKSVIRLKVAASGQLQDFQNINEFIDTIEHRYNGKVQISLVPQVFQSLDVYLSDFDQSSQKFITASNINEQYQLAKLARHEIQREDLGKIDQEDDFHPVGEKVFIGSQKSLIERLDRLAESWG